MVSIDLLCDHPDCSRRKRVVATAADITEARKLIIAGSVRCPDHGARADPFMHVRTDDSEPRVGAG